MVGGGVGHTISSLAMEKVAGMLEQMRLIDKEKQGMRIRKAQVAKSSSDPQAVGNVLSEKPVRADAIEATLGEDLVPNPRGGVQGSRR